MHRTQQHRQFVHASSLLGCAIASEVKGLPFVPTAQPAHHLHRSSQLRRAASADTEMLAWFAGQHQVSQGPCMSPNRGDNGTATSAWGKAAQGWAGFTQSSGTAAHRHLCSHQAAPPLPADSSPSTTTIRTREASLRHSNSTFLWAGTQPLLSPVQCQHSLHCWQQTANS